MQQPSRRRLTRGHERMIGGVASGLAEYLDLDPTIVRIGIVGLGLFAGPAVLLAYLVLLVVMPPATDESGTPVAPTGRGGGAAVVGIVLLAIGALMLVGVIWGGIWSLMGPLMWQGGVPHMWGGGFGVFWPLRLVWPVLIVLAGLFLLTRGRSR
jgi:phage shock protein C